MRKLVLFNGPPRSGKDAAIAGLLREYPTAYHLKLSQPLKHMTAAMLNMPLQELGVLEAIKDRPAEALFGMTYREFQIALAEQFLKPLLGQDVFGQLAVRCIHKHHTLVLCSDAGFYQELVPLVKLFGNDNVLIVQLHRTDCDFLNDSRGYVDFPNVTTLTLHNIGAIQQYQKLVLEVVNAWLQRSDN